MNSTGPPLLSRVRPAHWLVLDYIAAGVYAVPLLLPLINEASGTAGAFAVPVELVAFSLPIAVRRRHPVLAMSVLLVALSVVGLVQPHAVLLGLLPLAYVLYIVAATARPRTALLALAASLAAAVATALPDFTHLGAAVPFSVLYLVVWAVGFVVGQHRRYTADLLGYQARLAETELERARRSVVQERIQIARELHDVVAHGMSVITVQAGYGNLVMDTDPEAARSALGAIEATGRQTLTELRTLLTVLRKDEPGEGPDVLSLSPAPGLACLDELIERTAKAGVQVALTVTGRCRPLPAGIDLAAYRIVQEALTNVVKHADSSGAVVGLGYKEDELIIDVTDDGNGCPDEPPPVLGHGLVGIRERAHLYGGSVHAHNLSGGGFKVTCRIPVPADTWDIASSMSVAARA
jgi:signal transduction histidine kinase